MSQLRSGSAATQNLLDKAGGAMAFEEFEAKLEKVGPAGFVHTTT
jgi:hypothetical protein